MSQKFGCEEISLYSFGCGQIGESNKSIRMVVVELVASTDFDSHIQRFKVKAYLIYYSKATS